MSGGLFLVTPAGDVRAMAASPFPLEDQLQTLLERQPILLSQDRAGEQRLSLVRRETPVADATSARWSLDLLYVDQNGLLNLVEVKRGNNPESRREVVAQLLEYAANGYTRWTDKTLRNWQNETSRKLGADAAARLADDLDLPNLDHDSFWTSAAERLAAGKMRLIIVADAISTELQAIIEFLNAQMQPVEFLGLELKPFSDGDSRVLAPRWIGNTARAVEQKRATGGRAATAVSVEDWLTSNPIAEKLTTLIDFMKALGVTDKASGVRLNLQIDSNSFAFIEKDQFRISLYNLQGLLNAEDRFAILEWFRAAGCSVRKSIATGEPPVDVPDPSEAVRWTAFCDVIEKVVETVKAAASSAQSPSRNV